MAMAPIEEAAKGGKTVLRLFAVDDAYWPVVEFVADPGGTVRVSATNVPGAFGARRISADVDPELWKLAIEDIATLRRGRDGGAETVTIDIAPIGATDIEATLVCAPLSWFVLADGSGVSTPGMPAWNSCANRQGATIPALYALALHSLPPCDALQPARFDASGVARCLRILGRRDVAVELSNLVWSARSQQVGADDFAVITEHLAADARFVVLGDEPVIGREAFRKAWESLAPGRNLKIGLSTYQGLSSNEVEVRGEAYYGVDRDLSGRLLAASDQQLWFAPYHQVWVRGPDGWTIREFVIDRPVQAYGVDPVQRYLERIALNNSARR